MIESVTYKNYKVLRDATLPLGRFTLIVGPNGSGKSAALTGLLIAGSGGPLNVEHNISQGGSTNIIEIVIRFGSEFQNGWLRRNWGGGNNEFNPELSHEMRERANRYISGIEYFSLESSRIGSSTALVPDAVLDQAGTNLSVVLDRLRDQHPERFEALNGDLSGWIPEFDRILFETPSQGHRALMLRNKRTGKAIRATGLSEGTRSALALLTLSHLPNPPTVVEIEEPDRGIHPRLLRDVRDALYRLAYPENFGDSRKPVQVIATTHSPYFVDLFKDHPEEVVIAHKKDGWGTFERLSDRKDINDLLNGGELGEIWYSGILGGVPAET